MRESLLGIFVKRFSAVAVGQIVQSMLLRRGVQPALTRNR